MNDIIPNSNPNADAGASPPAAAPPPAAVAVPSSSAPAAAIPDAVPAAIEPAVAPQPADAAPVEPPATPVREPTLLEKFDEENKPPEVPAGEVKPAEEAKPADAAPPADGEKAAEGEAAPPADAAPPAEPLKYEPFKMPEGVQLNGDALSKFTEFAGSKHIPQDVAQNLIDMHIEAQRATEMQAYENQHKTFANTRANWAREVMADEVLGGASHRTSMGAIARARDLLVPEKERPAFNEFLTLTGAGDNPAFLRMMHRAARYMDEPSPPPPQPKPIPQNGKNPNSSGFAALYDKTNFNSGRQ